MVLSLAVAAPGKKIQKAARLRDCDRKTRIFGKNHLEDTLRWGGRGRLRIRREFSRYRPLFVIA